jgi:cysteine synthase
MGTGFVPDILDRSVIDEVITISSQTAFDTARALARYEGILGDIPSGPAIAADLEIGRRRRMAGKNIVVMPAILCGALTCRRHCLKMSDIEIALPSPT